jgi:hypothetical protein
VGTQATLVGRRQRACRPAQRRATIQWYLCRSSRSAWSDRRLIWPDAAPLAADQRARCTQASGVRRRSCMWRRPPCP